MKENQRIIDQQGRQKWQTQTNYGRRAKAENILSRFKIIIGNKIKSHNPKAQKNEVHIVILILNQMHKMGMPKAQIAAKYSPLSTLSLTKSPFMQHSLKKQGKPTKVALIVCMRKLLNILIIS